jgi:hypothetical protein
MTQSIQVISWNILNPDPDFVKMSLRSVVNQSPEKKITVKICMKKAEN